jgi:predicted phage tail protein
MSEMIEIALEAESEQYRAQLARVREEITTRVTDQVTAQVTAQMAQQVAEQMSAQMVAQMQAYKAKIHALVKGSKVVTSEPEVTNVVAPA